MTRGILAVLALIILTFGCGDGQQPREDDPEQAAGVEPVPRVERLRVATTTSLYDTGLWGYLEPMFEDRHGIELDVLYAGTGKALDWGRRGDVDVITVHSRSREEAFVDEGFGVERVPFAFNHFLVVGPPEDPAGIGGMPPEEAFAVLYRSAEHPFVSRGDDSGTHGKEKSIWNSAGYDYDSVRTAGEWYVEGGSGMGPTLVMADEMRAYTLTDIGTFLAYRGELDLVPVVELGDALLNVYSAIRVTASQQDGMAQALVDFLVSEEVQKLIGEYGAESYGRQLFTPCAGEDI